MPADRRNRPRLGRPIQTYTGETFYPLDPRASEVHYDDLVVPLARECRYGGHCREHYSVSTHSVLVSIYVERLAKERGWSETDTMLVAREGLLHDGAEAYGKDMPSPIKQTDEMRGYCRVLDRIQDVVFEWGGVAPTKRTTALVHEVDLRLRVDEVEALMLYPWSTSVEGLGATIPTLTIAASIHLFGVRFSELWGVEGRLDDSQRFAGT